MSKQRQVVEELLAMAGVAIDGPNPWDIQVRDDRLYTRILREKNLGLGEAYMEGWWNCARLDEFFSRILRARLNARVRGNLRILWPALTARLFNLQSRGRAGIIADRHYNIGNDLFLSFLDPYNQYSCAFFSGTEDLHQAQLAKMDLIGCKMDLGPEDRVLDIGCGWGGFAKYIAERFGCSVTAVNISREQLNYAREFCRNLPVQFLECDYRDIRGTFDKIVSVGMFEHVGFKNYRTFMKTVHHNLKDEGIFLLHTIGGNESDVDCDPWTDKYIFPNGMVPSLAQIGRSVEGLFVIEDMHNLGPHYDRTLMAWNADLQDAWPKFEDKYDEMFKRMWEYFLLSFAGAFRARSMQVWQIVMTKYGTSQPVCRF